MRLRTTLAASVLALPLSLLSPPTSAAAGQTYVALGDSYASGVGSRVYYGDSNGTSCLRSPKAYGPLIAAGYDLPLVLAACSGAVADDVTDSQLRSVTTTTRYITLTVGGNDLGFSTVLTECALPGWMSDCRGAVNGGLRVLADDLPGRLDTLLGRMRSRAPSAKVVLVGYPQVFNGVDCNAATFFSPKEQASLNGAVNQLNSLLQAKSSSIGAHFVNPVSAFAGHAWCSRREWINGLSYPGLNSYHPKVAGHSAYAQLVGPALLGRPLPLSTTQGRRASTAVRLPLATAPQPIDVQAPDLSSLRATRAATRAGITRSELRRLQQAQLSGASNTTVERLNAQITRSAQQRR